ncbi:MAG: hypothetical protein HYT99_08620 [Candidatus Tectomicrobia bacterium]|nr:hypothetical protein [Candidatus Tectomicrobia bacterium]
MKRKWGCRARTAAMASGQKLSRTGSGPRRLPQVLSITSGRRSMAMSQRTPSQSPAIRMSSSRIRSRAAREA